MIWNFADFQTAQSECISNNYMGNCYNIACINQCGIIKSVEPMIFSNNNMFIN